MSVIPLLNKIILPGPIGETCEYVETEFQIYIEINGLNTQLESMSLFVFVQNKTSEQKVLIRAIEVRPVQSSIITNKGEKDNFDFKIQSLSERIYRETKKIAEVDQQIIEAAGNAPKIAALTARKTAFEAKRANLLSEKVSLEQNPIAANALTVESFAAVNDDYLDANKELSTAGLEWIETLIPELNGALVA